MNIVWVEGNLIFSRQCSLCHVTMNLHSGLWLLKCR